MSNVNRQTDSNQTDRQTDTDRGENMTQFGEDRCTQFQVIMVTDPQKTPTNTHTNPQTGPITIHCAAANMIGFSVTNT